MDDRLNREKEYHNKAFSEGIRKSADKYYTIHKNSLKKLFSLLEKYAKDKHVLEYGCGPGHNAFFLARHAKKLIAIDISDYAIKKASEQARAEDLNNIEFLEMNAEALEFDDNSFDLIFGNSILHHLEVEKSYQEINRVLKPGGKAVFYEPLGHNFFINLYRKATPDMRTSDEHPLLINDIILAQKYFDNVKVNYYHLTTLLAVPFRKRKFFNRLQNIFSKFDEKLFALFPFLRKQAWFCILDLSKKHEG